MSPAKFKICIATFPYGGNGGFRTEEPEVGMYIRQVVEKAKADPRVELIAQQPFADTPVTMTRNGAIYDAVNQGFDALLMIDSDMIPDSEPDGKPFWDTSWDFFCNHYSKGPCVICAPYCGPPPYECVYAFRWVNGESDNPNPDCKLQMYPRDMAAQMTGIQEVGAQPTGIILFDTRVFELTRPRVCNDAEVLAQYKAGQLTDFQALKLLRQQSWCYYEYTDSFQRKKASTEDVTLTRDISFAGIHQYGYNPLYCNWDAWAGHVKPKIVRKPRPIDAREVMGNMRDALLKAPPKYKRIEVEYAPTRNRLDCAMEKAIPMPPHTAVEKLNGYA